MTEIYTNSGGIWTGAHLGCERNAILRNEND